VFNIVGLGDIHFGNPGCDIQSFERTVSWIADHPNTLWVGMGDYCECIEKQDKRFNWDHINKDFPTPQSQFRYMEETLKPIASQCIVLLDGNHEIAFWNKYSHNYTDGMAYNLSIPYRGIDSYIRLLFKRQSEGMKKASTTTYNIYAHHGYSASRGVGGKAKSLQDLSLVYPGCDLYLCGHTHAKGPIMPIVFTTFNEALKRTVKEMNFVYTGSFLDGHTQGVKSYAEEKAYAPLPLGAPFIRLEVERQQILGDTDALKPSFFYL
jgi:hypothetical protein